MSDELFSANNLVLLLSFFLFLLFFSFLAFLLALISPTPSGHKGRRFSKKVKVDPAVLSGGKNSGAGPLLEMKVLEEDCFPEKFPIKFVGFCGIGIAIETLVTASDLRIQEIVTIWTFFGKFCTGTHGTRGGGGNLKLRKGRGTNGIGGGGTPYPDGLLGIGGRGVKKGVGGKKV